MDVEEFTKKWGIKRSELSMLIDVPQGTMAHWFSANEDRTTPANAQKTLLYLDYLFTLWLQSESMFPEARAVFDSCCDRSKGEAFQRKNGAQVNKGSN